MASLLRGRRQPDDWADLATSGPATKSQPRQTRFAKAAPVRTFLARLLGVHRDQPPWRRCGLPADLVGLSLVARPVTRRYVAHECMACKRFGISILLASTRSPRSDVVLGLRCKA
jgi:hypothetical protein